MLASQLLYTSWKNGNSTTKGYMVYSKSRDITDIEKNEICTIMKYKAPDNLPYTPSNEEIENLFPKIFAYFRLSSGRFCLAQSSYIGQDYTNRWGNYIIHAYVFSDIEDLVPAMMIGADIFRTKLTEEELNADFAPEFLPQVDIEYNRSVLTEQEIKKFFNSLDKCNTLKALAQSVCDATSNNKHINFIDDLSNMRTWIITLSMIIPKSILNKVYFSTYSIEDSNLITLACKQSVSFSNTYTQPYMTDDLICINATRNNNIAISYYINAVCNKLLDDYYDSILCANNVNKLMLDYGCSDYNLVYKLACIQRGELDCVSQNSELLNIMKLLTKYRNENLSEIFDKIFYKYRNSNMYNGDNFSIEVLRFLYSNISAETKIVLLMMYVGEKIKISDDASYVYAEIKKDCPCTWDEAVMIFLRQSFKEHFDENIGDAMTLLLCNSWIYIYQKCNSDEKKRALNEIKDLYKKLVENHNTKAILCVLICCKDVNEMLYSDIYKSIYESIDDFCADSNYLFEYLKLSLDSIDLFWSVFLYALNHYPEFEEKYIKNFIIMQNEFKEKVNNLLLCGEKNQQICQFINNMNLYIFENNQPDNFEKLLNFYIKYILNSPEDKIIINKYRNIFTKKVSEFLASFDEKEKIKYSITFFNKLYCDKKIVEEDRDILYLLSKNICNDNQIDIRFVNKYLSEIPFKTIESFVKVCKSLQLPVHQQMLLIYEGCLFKNATEKKDKIAMLQIFEKYNNNDFTFLSKICSPQLLNVFLDFYFDVLLKGMYLIYKEDRNKKSSDLIDYFLEPISKSYIKFKERILQAWKKDASITNENILMYFSYIFEKTNELQKKLQDTLDEYLAYIDRESRNKIFSRLTNYFKYNVSDYETIVDKYIKEFNKKHRGFWDKFKDIFLVSEEGKNNGKKK